MKQIFSNPFICALLTAMVWGIAPILEKIGLRHIPIATALVIRCATVGLCSILFFIMAKSTGQFIVPQAKWAVFIIIGAFLAAVVGQFIFYNALKYGKASVVVPIGASYPLFAMIISMVFLKEPFSIQKAVGVVLIICGIVLIK